MTDLFRVKGRLHNSEQASNTDFWSCFSLFVALPFCVCQPWRVDLVRAAVLPGRYCRGKEETKKGVAFCYEGPAGAEGPDRTACAGVPLACLPPPSSQHSVHHSADAAPKLVVRKIAALTSSSCLRLGEERKDPLCQSPQGWPRTFPEPQDRGWTSNTSPAVSVCRPRGA